MVLVPTLVTVTRASRWVALTLFRSQSNERLPRATRSHRTLLVIFPFGPEFICRRIVFATPGPVGFEVTAYAAGSARHRASAKNARVNLIILRPVDYRPPLPYA